MKRLSVWQGLATLLLFVPLMAQATTVEVLGKHQRLDGSIYDFKVQDGDALSPGDRFQIVIEATKLVYYSIIYFSRDGKATQLFPLAGDRGSIRSGEKLFLPTRDNYFTLDTNGGRELMFIVTSPSPISNLKSVLRGSETVGASAQTIHQYLEKRLPRVSKLEITNTGGKVSGLADQVSSRLVRDISATYAANPWPKSVSSEPERRKRVRRQTDSSIPEEVRRRAREVRALLKRPAGAPSSSSLRTTVAQKSTALESSGKIRRDVPMLVDARVEGVAQENKRLQEERVAQTRAAEEIRRLEQERDAARLAAKERGRQETLTEEARIEAENERLQEERLVAAQAEEEVQRLEEERVTAQKAAAEASEIEQRQIELAKAKEAAKKLEVERIVAAQAATEIQRLEQEREAARLAAEERRHQEKRADAERIARESMRLEEERATVARAAAEIKRLEAEKTKALAEAEQVKPKEQEQEGFFGTIASWLGGGASTDGGESATLSYETPEGSAGESIVEASEPAQPVVRTEPQAPAEAIVVLQAPVRPQPPRMSAPAPVRAEVAPEQMLSAEDMRQLYDQVASSIVLIRTSNDAQASGFVLDNKGHVLTSWHVIDGVKNIDVQFTAIAGAQRRYKAQIVRQDKFRDLALLKLLNPPEGIQPITLASGPLPDAGTTVRVFGQEQGKVWATDDAVITRIALNFTWFSANNVIHRGEILQVDLPTRGKGIGALVTSMDYKMLGIKSFSGKETGRTYAVSVHNILEFLQPKK